MAYVDFSRGEISPYLRYRNDLEMYGKGCEQVLNFLPQPQGGIWRRYGSQILDTFTLSDDTIPACKTFNLGSTGLASAIAAPGADLTVTLGSAIYQTDNRTEDIPVNAEMQIVLAFFSPDIVAAYWINPSTGVPCYYQQLWVYDSGYVRPTLGFTDLRDVRVCQIENSVYIVTQSYVYELYWDINKVNNVSLAWNNSSSYEVGNVVYSDIGDDRYWFECTTANDSSTLALTAGDAPLFWRLVYPPHLSFRRVIPRVGEKLLTGTIFDDSSSDDPIDPLAWNANTTWANETEYKMGDVVESGGTYYECITDHESCASPGTIATDAAYWAAMTALSAEMTESDTVYRRRAYAGRTQTIPREAVSHQGRLLLAASSRFPATIFGSESGKFMNYGAGINDDDPWIFTVSGDRVGKILWMYVTDRLYIGTKGGIYAVSGMITPSNFLLTKVNSHSASEIEGVTAAGSLLYFQSDKKTLREVSYVDQQEQAYQATDVTAMANHLFESNEAVKMVVQHSPHTVIWILRDDGYLVALSFDKPTNLVAFSRHLLAESVVDITGGIGDDLYFIGGGDGTYHLGRMGRTIFAYGDEEQESIMLDGVVRNVVRDVLSEFEAYVQNDSFREWLTDQSITTIDAINAYEGPLNAASAGLTGYALQCALRHFTALESIDLSDNSLSSWGSTPIPASWTTIDFSDNDFTAADVNAILTALEESEAAYPRGGTPSIDLSGNAEATYAGLVAAVALIAAGWTVTLANEGTWWDGYTLTFDANGGTGTPPEAMSPLFQEVVTIPGSGTLERSGYLFGGWNTRANGTGVTYQEDDSYVMPGVDTTLYAKWIPVYSVAYNGNGSTGGTVAPTESYQAGTLISPADPVSTSLVRTGYTFVKWNTKTDGSGDSYYPGVPFNVPSQNLTLYAIWTLAVYTITYELYGGTNDPANPASYSITTATITLQDASRTGYTFGGWYEDAEFTVPITQIPIGSTGNKTVYAKLAINTYTLSFNKGLADGGDAPSSQSIAYNQSATLPLESEATMYKTGYHLESWHEKSDLSDTGYEPGASYPMPAANTTLYAKWVLNETRYVIFNNNGGSGTMSNQGIVEGNSANLTTNTFTRTGYTFAGWALTADGAVAYADGASITMGPANINLYAKWTINTYTVTFDSNGGSAVSSQTIDYGGLVTKPTNPTRTGYTFNKWVSGSLEWLFNSYTVSANMTLTALWTEIKVTSMDTHPAGGTSEYSPYKETVNTNRYDENYRDVVITVQSVTPSTALNKNAECVIRSGSSLVQEINEVGSPVNQFQIIMNYNASGIVKIDIRAEGNPSVVYYYEFTLINYG